MAAFVSVTTGAASRSVTVPSGTDRLLVVVALYTSTTADQSATYGGVTMSVATTTNDFVQIFYLIGPTAGSATLSVTGSNVDTVVAAHYTGVGSFQSAQQATGVPSASFSPNTGGVVVFGMEAVSTTHTPVANTNERYDTGGGYYADRLVTTSGAVTVGVSSATSPDYAGAIFLDAGVNASGTPTAPAPTVTGAADIVVSASGTATAPHPTASGGANIAVVSVAGTPSAPHPTAVGAGVAIISVSGSVSVPAPTAVGESIGATHPHASVRVHEAAGAVSVREPFARVSGARASSSVTED
jgi:hypothetical protein